MANTEMIREYIRASGYKLQYVARAMQISPNALGQKLQGPHAVQAERSGTAQRSAGPEHVRAGPLLFEEQNRREGWRAVRMKKRRESVTNEQRNKTRLALYRYGMRQRARNPVEHSWCAAIEESLTYYRQHDPLRADLFELRYVQHRTEDDVMDRLHIGRTTYKKPSRTC